MPTQPTIAMIPSGYGLEKIYSVLPTNGDADLQFSRGSVATRVDKSGLISNVQSNFPRLDYLDSTCPSLLLEPQRSNFILNSQAISLSPTKNGTFLDNFSISPDGTQNATKLTATTSDPFFYQAVSFSAGSYTASIYVKGIGSSIGKKLRVVLGGNSSDRFSITSEWTRFEHTAIMTSGSLNTGLEIPDPAVVGDEVLVWGWQVEQGSYPTSYIKTTGTSVTRNAETAFKTGVDAYINNSEGVFYLEISRLNQGQTGSSIWSLSNGSNSNAVSMYYANSGIVVDIFSSSGVKILNYGMSFLEQANFNKLIIKYKSNDIALWVNGLKVAVNTNAISLSGLNQINASYGGGEFPFLGKIKDLRVYNTALTDLELETLSSFTTFNAMALNFNYTIY